MKASKCMSKAPVPKLRLKSLVGLGQRRYPGSVGLDEDEIPEGEEEVKFN